MATNTAPNVCGICLEDYNEEERCPRILSCFHTLCTCCIGNLIADNKKQCPFCRSSFAADSSDNVTVNYVALDFIKYLAKMDSGQNKRNDSTSLSSRLEKMKNEALETIKLQFLTCEELEQQMEFTMEMVKDLEDSITNENDKILHEILPKFHETISGNTSALAELKQTSIQLKIKMKEIKNQTENVENTRQKIETATAETFKDVGEILDETEVVKTAVRASIEDVRLIIDKEEKFLAIKRKRTTKVGENSNIILNLLHSADDSEEEIDNKEGTSQEQLDTRGGNESAKTVVRGRGLFLYHCRGCRFSRGRGRGRCWGRGWS